MPCTWMGYVISGAHTCACCMGLAGIIAGRENDLQVRVLDDFSVCAPNPLPHICATLSFECIFQLSTNKGLQLACAPLPSLSQVCRLSADSSHHDHPHGAHIRCHVAIEKRYPAEACAQVSDPLLPPPLFEPRVSRHGSAISYASCNPVEWREG